MVEQLAAERQANLAAEMDMQDGKDEKTDDCPLHDAPKYTVAAACGIVPS
jgi:hypothetical protein